jgi:8-oxo-dGTP diphosphatase
MKQRTSTIRAVSEIDWRAWQPDDLATLCFIVKDGSILLIRKKRGLGAGKINGPGGRIDPGETPEQCAVREVQEELEITPLGLQLRGENSFQFVHGYSLHVYNFVADDFEGIPTETGEAIPLWFPLDNIPYHEMWADDSLWIPHMLKGTYFVGRSIFDDDEMLDYQLELGGDAQSR